MIKLLKYAKSVWWGILVTVCLLIFQAWLQTRLTAEIGNITRIVAGGTVSDPVNKILLIGGWMLLYAFGVLGCAITVALFASYTAGVFGRQIRSAIFKKINAFSLTEFDNFGTSSLITRTTNDIQQVKETFLMTLRTLTMAPSMMIMAIIEICTGANSDARLAIVLAVSIPVIVILMIVIFAIASPRFVRIQKAIDEVTLVLRENLTGVRVIRAFNQEEKEAKRFDEKNAHMTKSIIKVTQLMTIVNPVITIIFNMTFLGVYFVGFWLFDNVAATELSKAGSIVVTAQFVMQIMQAFMFFAMIFLMIPQASACATRINDVLNTKITINDPENTYYDLDLMKENNGVVEFKDVSFTFPDASAPTLQHISFKTKPGKTTAIIGSTGSGKSTIINLIPRFYDASQGEVLVSGLNVKNYKQHDLHQKIGFVPQQALLFTGTIRDNLCFGNKNATDEEINEALNVAQASHFVSKKDEGIYSEVSQGGKNFSGGQKQRLAIARALVKKPEIYIFDDSFSALDFKTDIRLRKALKDYIKDSSIIIVAQRVSSIIDADNIIVLQDGLMVGQGKHNKLLKTCQTYKEIVLSQLDPDEIKKTLQIQEQVLIEEGGVE